jgi:hypothetical protein
VKAKAPRLSARRWFSAAKSGPPKITIGAVLLPCARQAAHPWATTLCRFRVEPGRSAGPGQEETFAAPGYRWIERLEIYSARRLWCFRRSGSRTTKSNVGCAASAA